MRKLIYAINLTLDGCCDHTKGIVEEDALEYHANLVREVDTLLFGRKTWELMVPWWPEVAKARSGPTPAANDFAQAYDAVRETVVASRTLHPVEAGRTRVVSGDLREAVTALKQQEGGSILTGGVDVPTQLLKFGLVDECRFLVQPVIGGEGRRPLEGVSPGLRFKLIDTKVLGSGIVVLRYAT
jgi:dihydrofolate reductase